MKVLIHAAALGLQSAACILYLASMAAMAAAVGHMGHTTESQTYIIHFDEEGTDITNYADRKQWHTSVLASVTDAKDPGSLILYSYETVINGFAAKLRKEELSALQMVEGFMAAYPDTFLPLQITYSYRFLGLDAWDGLWQRSKFGEGVIIGVLDTGIWPESPSFKDDGMPSVPKRWKGICQIGRDFNASHCNNKLIGARYYNSGHQASASESMMMNNHHIDYESPRDSQGHGTHTASTAAGNSVSRANLLGNARGTARGMAPSAHIAMYKVCWNGGCYSSDILAGMDRAISDGVDVISLSIGGFSVPFHQDSIAIGAFRATQRGVFVSCAAGNSGPYPKSISNEAPWVTTVGASTLDRNFPAKVRLGNGKVLYGESLYPGMGSREKPVPLVYAGSVAGLTSIRNARYCFPNTLNSSLIAGKMVVCDRGSTARAEKGEVVRRAGGSGMILADSRVNGEETAADAHVLPATQVGYREANAIKAYINSTMESSASIEFDGTVYGILHAPAVASFSSRGPSSSSPGILKPDLIAPGVNILAAWPMNLGPSGLKSDKRRVKFNVVSGTSMACPHVAGVAALVKNLHPGWSSAAIKSALMTTADIVDKRGGRILDTANDGPAGVFAIGAGHMNPDKAADPGLIYDTGVDDYLRYLCSLRYTRSQILIIANRTVHCSKSMRSIDAGNLNYPSFSVFFNVSRRPSSGEIKLRRTVTNVGHPESMYSVHIDPPKGVHVKVKPTELYFSKLNEKKSYTVKFTETNKKRRTSRFTQGSLTWILQSRNRSNLYTVRSPIAITWSS